MKTFAGGRYNGDGEIWANGTNIPSPAWVYNKKLPLLSIRVRGAWASTHVFQVLHGRQYIRKLSAIELAGHRSSDAHYALTLAGIRAWQSLTRELKIKLDRQASKRGLRMAGYHYFMRLWFKNRPALKDYYPAGRD
jgi:hypothetical protein